MEKHMELHSSIYELDVSEISVIPELILFQGLELFPAAVPFSKLARANRIAETAIKLKSFQVQRVKYMTHGNSLTETVQKLHSKTGIASKMSHKRSCINLNPQRQTQNPYFNTVWSTISQTFWMHHLPSG